MNRMNPEWRTSTVVQLCQSMRETNDYSALPILADALQDAGCDDDVALTQLRLEHNSEEALRAVSIIYSDETESAVRTIERLAEEMGPRAFCEEGDGYGEPVPTDYTRLMRVGDRWTSGGEWWNGTVEHGSEGLRDGDLSGEFFVAFWDAYRVITGKIGEGNPFGCTC